MSSSPHLQFAASTAGKKGDSRKQATQCLGTVVELVGGLRAFLSSAQEFDQADLTHAALFNALAISCPLLSYLTPEMADGVEGMTDEDVRKLASTLKAQGGGLFVLHCFSYIVY